MKKGSRGHKNNLKNLKYMAETMLAPLTGNILKNPKFGNFLVRRDESGKIPGAVVSFYFWGSKEK